jgi:hypothetical protein
LAHLHIANNSSNQQHIFSQIQQRDNFSQNLFCREPITERGIIISINILLDAFFSRINLAKNAKFFSLHAAKIKILNLQDFGLMEMKNSFATQPCMYLRRFILFRKDLAEQSL